MSFVKNQLKLARDSIGKKDFNSAKNAADQVLQYEPENYNAHVFMALALLELGEVEQSERFYRAAIALNNDQPLAWQGISKLYERTENWEKYADTLEQLMKMYNKIGDATKCAETLQKLLELRRLHGSRTLVVQVLLMLLPDSKFYATLSALPPPDPTNPAASTTFTTQEAIQNSLPVIQEIVKITEEDEDQTLKKEFEKRRMRLGAPAPDILKKEVGREIWSKSRLPYLYNEILNHPHTSDEVRFETESSLLRFKQNYLHSLPNHGELAKVKLEVSKELDNLVDGAVLLKRPEMLAWMIFLEGKNCENVADYGYHHMVQFMELFPSSSMTSFLKGYFQYSGMPLAVKEKEEINLADEGEDPLDSILNAYIGVSNTILGNRILSEVHLAETDYENAIKVAKSGLEVLERAEIETGKKLQSTRTGFQVVLATSYVHLFPPKHHARALSLIDDVLLHSPNNVPCLMGRGYILQESERWEDAVGFFEKVVDLFGDNDEGSLRAKEELAWCRCQICHTDDNLASLRAILDILQDINGRNSDCARCLWRIGKCCWDMGDLKREEAYKYFISCLKQDSEFAPAYTSLGFYYSHHVSPPDPIRASKCFQKAFELDAREDIAARYLAQGFAEDQEWDLVEVVARRTIEGEGGLDAGLKNADIAGGRYLPKNGWAWKAIGVVELNRRNYGPAIQALQLALRAEPDDQLSWLRLGEAYSKAGRHAAAVKALGRAHELQLGDWICSYFIGDVKQRMGLFQEAIIIYQAILDDRPSEAGVLFSLGQAWIDLARKESSEGFQIRAEQSFLRAIQVGLDIINRIHGFRAVAWKLIGDSVFSLSQRMSFYDEDDVHTALNSVIACLPSEIDHQVSGIFPMPSSQQILTNFNSKLVLEIAMHSYSYRLSLGVGSQLSNASAWFDLAISLQSWLTKHGESIENSAEVTKKVVHFLTEALREDPGNEMYWSALGNVNFSSDAKASQYAYIKALEIDSKNTVTWVNLGLLYLHQGDLDLASEALSRCQILDPDFALAWVGQALVAAAKGHDIEVQALFDHAVGLPMAVHQADYEFADRTFSALISSLQRSTDLFLPVFFAMDRYCTRNPKDSTGLHLFGLICESIGHLELGERIVNRAIVILEAVYEDSEDALAEKHYIISNATLGRLKLSAGDFQGAMESFEIVLSLLPEDNNSETYRVLRVQANTGSALAYLMQQDLQTALTLLQSALEAAGDEFQLNGHVTIILAQTMWAIGTEEFKESAKSLLLGCITTNPENLTAINTLAGMGILTDDDGLVDAALSEILALSPENRRELDPGGDVEYLLMQHFLAQGDAAKASSVAQRSLLREPSASIPRNRLATLALRRDELKSAFGILLGSSSKFELPQLKSESLALRAITLSNEKQSIGKALSCAQRAIMLAPSDLRNWQTLAYTRSRMDSLF